MKTKKVECRENPRSRTDSLPSIEVILEAAVKTLRAAAANNDLSPEDIADLARDGNGVARLLQKEGGHGS